MIRLYRRAARQLLADVARELAPRHRADCPVETVDPAIYGPTLGWPAAYAYLAAKHRSDRP